MSLNLQSHTISQRKSLKLKGTKTSVTKNQILVSTGIVSLDAVLDGGIPIGTVALVEEENYGRNADLITKHFIAEGVVSDHSILIADVERKPEAIANDLPKPIQEDSFQPTNIVAEDFKIAWRYSQNPMYDSKPYHTSISFGHTFDISAKIPVNELQNIRYWPADKSQGTSYSELLEHINTIITKGGFSTKIPVEKRNVLRITISNLFSPIWDSNDMNVVTFLYKLRILVRSSYATCLITTQAHVIDDVTKCRIEHFVDSVLIFKPMELSSCADYNGKLIIGKLASFNTFLYEPLSVDWATKLTRKKLCIESDTVIEEILTNDDEQQYLDHIKNILEKGHKKMDRTRVGTLSLFGAQMRYNLKDGIFPLLTTKRVFWRGVVEELLWFIKGSTNSKELSEKDVKVWDANSTRSYLDSIGLTNREEGDLGPVYGFQWRHYGTEYVDMHTDYSGKGIDQLQNVIDTIKTNPGDRRMLMIAWNPCDVPKMALPPCHCLVQFFVADGYLSCQMYQRSADMGLGVPFNIASYSLLTYMIAHVTGLKPGEFIHTLGDSHIYLNHIDALKMQLQRKPRKFPLLTINREVKSIDDFKFGDFTLSGYNPYPKISMDMAV